MGKIVKPTPRRNVNAPIPRRDINAPVERRDVNAYQQRRDVNAKVERNPLDELPRTGNIETDDAAETSTVFSRIKGKQREIGQVVDNGYWFALVFVSADQREEFLSKTGWRDFPHAHNMYWDGLAVAEEMGIELKPESLPFRERTVAKKIVERCGLIEQPPH